MSTPRDPDTPPDPAADEAVWGRPPAGGWGGPQPDERTAHPHRPQPGQPGPTQPYPAEADPTQRYPAPSSPAPSYPPPAAPAAPYPTRSSPAQPYPAQPYPAEADPTQRYPAPSYPVPSSPAPSYPPPAARAAPYPTRHYPAQPYAGAPYAGQPYPGQPYPGQPYPGQPPGPQWPPGPGEAHRGSPTGRPGGRSALPFVIGGVTLVVLALVAVLAFVTPGFLVTRIFDATAVQAGVQRVLTVDYGLAEVRDVSCDQGVEVVVGASFTCRASVEGEQVSVPIRITGADGAYEVGRPA